MLLSYSPGDAKVDNMEKQVDDSVVCRQKAVCEFLSEEGISAKGINDRPVFVERSLSYRNVRRKVVQ